MPFNGSLNGASPIAPCGPAIQKNLLLSIPIKPRIGKASSNTAAILHCDASATGYLAPSRFDAIFHVNDELLGFFSVEKESWRLRKKIVRIRISPLILKLTVWATGGPFIIMRSDRADGRKYQER
jgi:hypothetical protein